MGKNVLVITDLEGALISKKAPEVEGRRYMVVTRNKWEKKVMANENIDRLKKLNEVADIVPMTKLAARQCSAMALCVNTPMSLVESGAILLIGNKPDNKWKFNTMEITFNDDDILRKGTKLLSSYGYEKNGDGEYTLDYVLMNGERDVDADCAELESLIGEKYNVLKVSANRLYAYHKSLSRRAMVQKFIDSHPYEKVIAIAADNTGWLPNIENTISIEGNNATYEFDRNEYENDLHKYTAFALDKALELAKG